MATTNRNGGLFVPSPHAGVGTTASVLALSDSLAVSALALALDKGPMSGVPSVTRNVTCCLRQFWINQLFLPRARGEMGLFESEASGVTVGCTKGFDKFNQISQVNIGMHRQTQVLWIIETTMLRL